MSARGIGWAALGVAMLGVVGWRLHRVVNLEPDQGAPFALVDARSGLPFTEATLYGTPTALFFGFTSCPEVCPTTLARAKGHLDALGPEAPGLRFVFVTVDPERDTPHKLAAYLGAFDPRIVGLTGSRSEVDKAMKRFGIFAQKVEHGDTYSYDHTALVLLIDRCDG